VGGRRHVPGPRRESLLAEPASRLAGVEVGGGSGGSAGKKRPPRAPGSASREIDAIIEGLGDWRATALSRVRRPVREADPDVVEEVKWKKPSDPAGVPIWSHDGIICTGGAHANHVRLTFARGASLSDPSGLFNSGLNGRVFRAVVLQEGDDLDAASFRRLIRAAVARNASLVRGEGSAPIRPRAGR
jgi:hypothetical protein